MSFNERVCMNLQFYGQCNREHISHIHLYFTISVISFSFSDIFCSWGQVLMYPRLQFDYILNYDCSLDQVRQIGSHTKSSYVILLTLTFPDQQNPVMVVGPFLEKFKSVNSSS